MKKVLKDKSFRLAIILTLIFFGTGTIFLLLGLVGFSWVIFALLPIILGISIGALPDKKWGLLGAIIAAVFFLIGLMTLGLSGFICIVMALPLILPFIFLGSVITHLAKRYREIKSDKLPVLILPLILFLIAAPVEKYSSGNQEKIIEVRTTRVFNYSPDQVFDAIKSVDTLNAEKPFLMYFDLPVPTKCILDNEEVGGTRTCYFGSGNFSRGDFGKGKITERITEIERGKILRMDVIGCDIIGRKWLGFKEAVYLFEQVGNNSCKLTRITTYTSELAPRFYWGPLEKLGIQQEHQYVLNNLEKDLKIRYGS